MNCSRLGRSWFLGSWRMAQMLTAPSASSAILAFSAASILCLVLFVIVRSV
jgi:hypothetical protein